MFPNSTHCLFSVSVPTQEDLLNVWKIVKHITVTIAYEDTYGKKQPKKSFDLAVSYKSFEDALLDNNPIIEDFKDEEIEFLKKNMRRLEAFQKKK